MSAKELDEIVTKRREFLAALADSPATKPELVDRLDTSRSTVDRAIEELQQFGLVHRPEDEYQLTLGGQQAYEWNQTYLDRLGGVADAGDILASLPQGAPFTLDLLDGAQLEQAEPHNPLQPLELSADIMSEATQLRQVSPAVFPVCVDIIGERAEAGTLDLELAAPPDVIEAMREAYGGEIRWLDTDGCTLYELDERPPYALWVAETPDGTYTGLLSNSETGVRGLIVNDNDQSREWALEQYERYREGARPVEEVSDRA